MQIFFWLGIIVLFLVLVYQFIPSIQIAVDDKWYRMTGKLARMSEDKSYRIPDELQPVSSSILEKGVLGMPGRDGLDSTNEDWEWKQGKRQVCVNKEK